MRKIILFILLFSFVLASQGVCADGHSETEATHACVSCCHVPHESCSPAPENFFAPIFTRPESHCTQTSFYSRLFTSGIDHPPKSAR